MQFFSAPGKVTVFTVIQCVYIVFFCGKIHPMVAAVVLLRELTQQFVKQGTKNIHHFTFPQLNLSTCCYSNGLLRKNDFRKYTL